MWARIVEKADIQFSEFATHSRYPVMTPVAIAEACVVLLDGIRPNVPSHTAQLGTSPSDGLQVKKNGSGANAESTANGEAHNEKCKGSTPCGHQVLVTVSDPSGAICTPLTPNSSSGSITLIEQITLPGKKADLGDFLELWGCWFVDYCSTYGFDRIMRAAGRHYM